MTAASRLPEQIELGDGYVALRWNSSHRQALSDFMTRNAEHLRPWMAWADEEPLGAVARAAQLRLWDNYWRSGRGCHFGIFDAAEQILGGCALHRRVGPRGIDLGYWLGAQARGLGLATRAARSLAAAALEKDDIDFVEISHAPDNPASGRVAARIGAKQIQIDASVVRWRLRAVPPATDSPRSC